MKTIETTVYELDELNDTAKDRAREWYRSGALDYEWWEFTYADAESIGLKITGFDLERSRHCKGKLVEDACHCADKIIANHGEFSETVRLAEAFLRERDEIVTAAERDEDGELTDERGLDCKLDDLESEFERALLEEYAMILDRERDYLLSDEQVDESIRCNEYTFTESGKREG